MRSVKVIATLVVASALCACSKAPPTEAARQAEAERMAALARASQEEEREKDRQARDGAARMAREMTQRASAPAPAPPVPAAVEPPAEPPPEPAPAPAPAQAQWQGPGPAPATSKEPTVEDKFLAQATGRIRTAMRDVEAMRVRAPKTRDNNSILCVEVDAKPKGGAYPGFVPVIVTPDRVYVYRDQTTDAVQVEQQLDFTKLNARLRCW